MLCSVVLLAAILMICPTTYLSWFGLAAVGVVFGVLYAVAILPSAFLDEYDWKKLESLTPAVRLVRRISRIA